MKTLTLYVRPGCHLCEDAAALLRRLGWAVEEVNIDAEPELRRRYDYLVPVVVVDGREVLSGIISEQGARAALRPYLQRR